MAISSFLFFMTLMEGNSYADARREVKSLLPHLRLHLRISISFILWLITPQLRHACIQHYVFYLPDVLIAQLWPDSNGICLEIGSPTSIGFLHPIRCVGFDFGNPFSHDTFRQSPRQYLHPRICIYASASVSEAVM